mmetsp:Transcript_3715/g.7709  ORF Transcript_3715/g.7709 Transcript_3715/m.7709 type:complete len:204 (+) Transcript_3715:1158-1769(+)
MLDAHQRVLLPLPRLRVSHLLCLRRRCRRQNVALRCGAGLEAERIQDPDHGGQVDGVRGRDLGVHSGERRLQRGAVAAGRVGGRDLQVPAGAADAVPPAQPPRVVREGRGPGLQLLRGGVGQDRRVHARHLRHVVHHRRRLCGGGHRRDGLGHLRRRRVRGLRGAAQRRCSVWHRRGGRAGWIRKPVGHGGEQLPDPIPGLGV